MSVEAAALWRSADWPAHSAHIAVLPYLRWSVRLARLFSAQLRSQTQARSELSSRAATRPQAVKTAMEITATLPATADAVERTIEMPSVGAVVGARYRIVKPLGTGGMGTVLLAHDDKLNREVVLKLLSQNLRSSPSAVERFHNEARAASALNHRHIVTMLDAGEESGAPYLVMEYLRGESLADVLAREGPLPWAWAQSCVSQVLSALSAAHEKGIVHRDVKPSNCLCVGFAGLAQAPQIKLLDFGIAKFDSGLARSSLTDAGMILGTLTYLSPEQARGASIDARSDLYSVAIMLFELLTGRPPFVGHGSLDIMLQHVNDPPPRLSDVAPHLTFPSAAELVIARALEKTPATRFQTAPEFAEALEHVSSSARSKPPSKSEEVGDLQSSTLALARPLPADDLEWFELRQLLDKVRRFWLESVLGRSEFGGVLLPQERTVEFDSLASTWEAQYRRFAEEKSVTDVPVSQIFEDLNRVLLLTGEAGCGKTLTLLTLARYLGSRSNRHEQYREPVPVVFSLSSWTAGIGSLESWLAVEFGSKYQVPERLARRWLEHQRIVPLLDGLDEVDAAERERCVRAINAFIASSVPPGIVVACRSATLERLSTRLHLNGAVHLHPLTGQQIDEFLERGGSRWAPLRNVISADTGLKLLTRTPLMLNLIARSLGESSRTRAFQSAPQTPAIDRVFEAYIDEMRRRAGVMAAEEMSALRWHLSWLARAMIAKHQTVFRIEDLQPSWLEKPGLRWAYALGTRFAAALLLGLSSVLSFGTSPLKNGGFRATLAYSWRLTAYGAVFFGLGYGVVAALKSQQASEAAWRRIVTNLLMAAGLGIIVGGLASGGSDKPAAYVIAFELGLAVSVVLGMGRQKRSLNFDIAASSSIRWRWHKFLRALPLVLVATAVIFWAAWMKDPLAGAYIACLILLLGSIMVGLEAAPTPPNETPNHGMHRALYRAAIAFGGAFTVTTAIFAVSYGLSYGASVGLSLGTLLGLRFGGFDALCHYVLRALLAFDARLKPNLAKTLDRGSELAVLRRAGGGYIFMHRSLMDYLARAALMVSLGACSSALLGCDSVAYGQTAPAGVSAAPASCADAFPEQALRVPRPSGVAGDVFAADVDGDGNTDLVVAAGNDLGQAPLSVLYGPFETGRIPARQIELGGREAHRRLAVGDVNGDGVLDIAVALAWFGLGPPERPSVKFFVSSPDRSWTEQVLSLRAPANAVAFGDVDHDGDLDAAVMSADLSGATTPKDVELHLNEAGRFTRADWQPSFPLHSLSGRFSDLDGDGALDLLVTQIAAHNDALQDWCAVFLGTPATRGEVALARHGLGCGLKRANGENLGHVYAVDVEPLNVGSDAWTVAAALNNERCAGKTCDMPRAIVSSKAGSSTWESNEHDMAAAVRVLDLDADNHTDLLVATWHPPFHKKAPGPITVYCGEKGGGFGSMHALRESFVTQGVSVADFDNKGLRARTLDVAAVKGRATPSVQTLTGPVQRITGVSVDGQPLSRTHYAYVPGGNWVSVDSAVLGEKSLHVDYQTTDSPDVAIVAEGWNYHVLLVMHN